tara:strand:+ start:166 stop:834 length:669 start_codon:yes stop_codon:yes gene_type:complete
MNKKILEWPAPVLKKVSPPAVIGDSFTKKVVEDLTDTFRVVQGYGLAAPQIGYSTRAFIVSPRALGIGDEEQLLMINPTLSDMGDMARSSEACFSVPDLTATVNRHSSCVVKFQNESGEHHEMQLEGLAAFCVQHELDHLDGKTMLEKVGRMTRSHLLKKRRKLHQERARLEEEYRREFEEDANIYLQDSDTRPKRVSKTSKAKKRMQRLSRKLNQKKKKKK